MAVKIEGLCGLLRRFGGLKSSRNISVEEKVAMFLSFLAHHTKNRCVKFRFKRSGQTVSKHFNRVLNCILSLQYIFLVPAESVDENTSDVRWSKFQSKLEEDALISCLIDIVNDGWKAENSIKVGFQRELEKKMRKMLPGTDIVANPQINSKIHVWKKEYGALSDLLSKSGIEWNSTTSMIEVSDEDVWDSSRHVDPHLKSVCFKSWPYYSQWLEIFGKDRATGENAVDPIDLFQELMHVDLELEEKP
ncbi:hypothetical protein ACS0TY_019070 [Phlomoides rotata]